MQSLVNFFNNGGPVMYIILFVFAIGLSILIERTIFLFRCRINSNVFMQDILSFLQAGKVSEATDFCKDHTAPLPLIIGAGITRSSHGEKELKEAVDEVAINEIPKLLKRTHYLQLIANVATLLGLLGTIFGLMQSFVSVGSVDPSQKAALLASGISTAMNTTAFGLMVAIPFMVGHAYLNSTTQDIIHDIDRSATRLVSFFSRKNDED
ncbi:MAG: MotA/TolQ/ExbB proton channel family protein [Nitrospinota bacterium]